MADFDGDGGLDIVVNNNDAVPTIYLNRVGQGRHWLGLRLEGRRSNRDAVGTTIRLTAGGRSMTRAVEAGSGYASQSPLAVHFGLGDASRVDAVEITWPSGDVERYDRSDLASLDALDRTLVLTEGTSLTAASPDAR